MKTSPETFGATNRTSLLGLVIFCLVAGVAFRGQSSFVNFETAPVHPIALSPDGHTLAICNLPDGRVELFDVSSGIPVPIGDVPVGVDPVSVRFRGTNELWVANYISRTVNVVDVARRLIVDTVATLDGPADIAFAGSPAHAFVSCAKENTVQVIDATTRQLITNLLIHGERPKAMALSPDGTKLYVAIFESGNGSTILVGTQPDTDKILKDPRGPYAGQFPVPNDGTNMRPPINTNLFGTETRMPDSIVVKKSAAGRWLDDNNGDWSEFVSGTNAALSGRIAGWDLPDRDIAVIDTATLDVSYIARLMNICMDVAVNPVSGRISLIGTDGTNERRFEPNLRGTFVRVNLALIDPASLSRTILDLNPHLDYFTASVPQNLRDRSIGDPRGIVWNSAGTRGYITGMGSRNLVVVDADGHRVGSDPIELEEGPSGLALDEARQRVYVLNRFSATISVLDTGALNVVTNVALFDPTPPAIKTGRKHLYDTRRNSGLGQLACASCHVDARFDRLAWDLGAPRGLVTEYPGSGFPIHPMKGPLVTQTLQDVINPPEIQLDELHWRGDRPNIESFNITFTDLLARDVMLATNEMQEFKDFLSEIYFGPSRFRNLDNSFPTSMPLPGLFGVDSNGVPDRTPLPNGNAERGMDRFFNEPLNGRFSLTQGTTCTTCHNRQSGAGNEGDFRQFEREEGRFFRGVPLRTMAEKLGMDLESTNGRTGFGFRFDGREDTLTREFADVFQMTNNQAIADFTAFLFALPGSGLFTVIAGGGIMMPPNDTLDSHAALGKQLTVRGPGGDPLLPRILELGQYDEWSAVNVVARGIKDGLNRSWLYRQWAFQSDRNNEQETLETLLALATPDAPLTFTVLQAGTAPRIALDRDEDGVFNRTEIDYGLDPSKFDPILNRAPQIGVSGESLYFIHPGFPAQLTFGAVDPDVPPQRLTFSLDPGAPDGASIDAESGLFTWTPTDQQSERYYRLWARVTDDGVPPLSRAMLFEYYVVSLRVIEFRREQPGVSVVVGNSVLGRTIAGHSYRLQYKDRLDASTWINIGDPVQSNGFAISLRDSTAPTATQRFYRIVLAE